MSSAGRAANSSGCVARPRAREIGLIGFAAQIRRSLLTGSYVMETAEHREPCESRGSRTVLGAPGGEILPGDSTISTELAYAAARCTSAVAPRPDANSRNLRRRGVPKLGHRPDHSITSSARSRSDVGSSIPSLLALLRLTITSNFTARSI